MWPKLLVLAAVAVAGTTAERTTQTPEIRPVPPRVEPIIAMRLQTATREAVVGQHDGIITIR